MDAKGRKVFAQADENGEFSLSYVGKQFPMVLTVASAGSYEINLMSVLAEAPQDTDAPARVNINPLTSARAAMLTSHGDLAELTDQAALARLVTPATLLQVNGALNTALTDVLKFEHVDITSFDPAASQDTHDHAGLDAVLADVLVRRNGEWSLASVGKPEHAIPLRLLGGRAATLEAPPEHASYLNRVQHDLALALKSPAGVQSRIATAVVVPSLQVGATNEAAKMVDLSALLGRLPVGASIDRPVTDHFSLATDGRLYAVLHVPYHLSSGERGQLSAVALHIDGGRATQAATWSVIGGN